VGDVLVEERDSIVGADGQDFGEIDDVEHDGIA